MSYLFDGLWAIDPVNPANVALNAEVVIFDPADAGHSPIPLTDGDGFALPNPLTTNEKGFVGAFRADLDRVGWEAAGLTGYITSYDGLKGAAEAAAASAADASAASLAASGNAAEAAVAAQQAATLVNSPADDVVAMLVGGAGSQTQSATDTRYSKRGEAVLLVPDYAVGDGITDDTAAIQTVFSIAAQFGHIVDFGSSEHTYYMAGVVEVGSNTVVQGRGATLIKKTVAGESSYAFFCTRSHGSAFYGAGGSSIRFNNMKFRGTFPDRPACAFSGHHSDDVQFHGCTFEQMAGTGHVVDLSGCQDVVFRDCRFIGATDVNSRAEAIQIDISARGAISVLDDDGSYSGMPTRRVTVDNCKFLPLTLDGVTYPAPVPMGSHAQWEGKWFEDISFINNTVINGRLHSGTRPVGLLHFSCIDGLTIRNNTFVNTLTATGRVVGITFSDTGVLAGADPNSLTPTSGTFPQVMRAKNIDVAENKFRGFLSAADDPIYIQGCDVVSVTTNKFDGCGSLYDIRDVVGFTAHSNQYKNPPANVSAQIVNLNKVTKMTVTAEVIDVTGATNLVDIISISNNSAVGSVSGNVIIGKGAAGITQVAGSTVTIGTNVLV